jgi:exodeoxyribonuclease VIII
LSAHLTYRMPFAEYVKIPAIHFSTLKAIDTSPLHYAHAVKHQRGDTDALRLGRILHAMVLDPSPPDVAIYEGKVRRGKEWEAFAAEHCGQTILRRDEIEKSVAMRAALLAHPIAGGLLAEGEGEVTVEWSMMGHACRGRLDWLRPDGSFVELKTTRRIAPRAFARDFGSFLYHAQIAFYRGGLEAALGVDASEELPRVIAVENEPPHDVAVYPIGYDVLEAGQRKVDEWIRKIDACRTSRRWPGVAEGEIDLRLADWILSEGMPDVDVGSIGGDVE